MCDYVNSAIVCFSHYIVYLFVMSTMEKEKRGSHTMLWKCIFNYCSYVCQAFDSSPSCLHFTMLTVEALPLEIILYRVLLLADYDVLLSPVIL